jgi:hypothetical protein
MSLAPAPASGPTFSPLVSVIHRPSSRGSGATDGKREPSEHGQVGVESDALDPTDAEERESVAVLQASELALDSRAGAVEAAPLGSPARDA